MILTKMLEGGKTLIWVIQHLLDIPVRTPTIDFFTFMNIPLCSGHIQN
jgi:hypothetical protein